MSLYKRWYRRMIARDAAEYLAEFRKHVTPELLAKQLYKRP